MRKRLMAEGVSEKVGDFLAVQFAGLALGEWQRRLIFGGDAMTDGEIQEHASAVSTMFLEGALAGFTNGPSLDMIRVKVAGAQHER